MKEKYKLAELYSIVTQQTPLLLSDIKDMVKHTMESMDHIVTEEGALFIVANNLAIKIPPKQATNTKVIKMNTNKPNSCSFKVQLPKKDFPKVITPLKLINGDNIEKFDEVYLSITNENSSFLDDLYKNIANAKKLSKLEPVNDTFELEGYRVTVKSDVYEYGGQMVPTAYAFAFNESKNIGMKVQTNIRDKTINVFMWDTYKDKVVINDLSEYDPLDLQTVQVFSGTLSVNRVFDIKEFTRKNGTEGCVLNVSIVSPIEDTKVTLTFWDQQAIEFARILKPYDTIMVISEIKRDDYGIKLTYS